MGGAEPPALWGCALWLGGVWSVRGALCPELRGACAHGEQAIVQGPQGEITQSLGQLRTEGHFPGGAQQWPGARPDSPCPQEHHVWPAASLNLGTLLLGIYPKGTTSYKDKPGKHAQLTNKKELFKKSVDVLSQLRWSTGTRSITCQMETRIIYKTKVWGILYICLRSPRQ